MKKLKYLFFILPLFLIACIRPPIPDVEQAIQDADPSTITPLSNELTQGHFMTALPLQPSPTRGLILDRIRNRADVEQIERSLMRIAADFFDPTYYYLREGQYLSRQFAINILQAHDPEESNHMGLNPAVGTSVTFDERTFENGEEDTYPIRPLAHVLEQNFVTIHQNADGENEFRLEGVAIALALNPYHWERDRAVGFENEWRMTDDQIIAMGQEFAATLLPLLRQQEGLEDVPIILGLYILKSDREVIPGGFASMAYIESGRAINAWTDVHERHFRLPDPAINTHDVHISSQVDDFKNTVHNHFPHPYGIVARAHVVNDYVYLLEITFNMSFYGFSEKSSFHQLVAEQLRYFSPEYDIRIIVRSPSEIHGSVTRPPNSEPVVHLISW